ncbi:hypothetical protein IPC1502_06415 [Pseudomonas aeruginosa]|nr:hypothetical protein IPC1502_06415 [Pseudomonas aeruginosa]
MGNSLCLCRALSIYEFKSDRLLAWRKGVINQASWKHHSTASNGRCEVYRQPPASGRPDRSKNRRICGEPSDAGPGKAQAPWLPGTPP